MRFSGFIGPSYTLRSKNVDCQRCVNLYPELDEIGTGKEKEVAALVSTPGLNNLVTIPTSGHRGAWTASNAQQFVVVGNGLYQIDAAWNYTLLGNLQTYQGQVSLADNGLQLVVVDGPNGYYWDFTALTFTKISDPNFFGADMVAYQDGYFIFNRPGTNQSYLSDLLAVTFTAPVIFSKEGNPDAILAVISAARTLWLMGSQTIEVWYDTGDNLNPFQPIQGAYIEYGLGAKFSAVKLNNTIFWLGSDSRGTAMVMTAVGYQPQRISTHAIETAIQGYSTVSDAVGYGYQEEGHNFYVLNFPSASATWVYDTTTGLWHERAYLSNGVLGRHRGNTHAIFNGVHIVGDYANGNLYQMSIDFQSDNGNPIKRLRAAPHLSDGLTRIFYESLQLDMETGVGLDGIGQGVDPKVILRWSDDGGHKWSNEKWWSAGKIGQTRKRVKFDRLGQSRDRVFEVSITDPVRVILIGAEIALSKGAS